MKKRVVYGLNLGIPRGVIISDACEFLDWFEAAVKVARKERAKDCVADMVEGIVFFIAVQEVKDNGKVEA